MVSLLGSFSVDLKPFTIYVHKVTQPLLEGAYRNDTPHMAISPAPLTQQVFLTNFSLR